MDSNIKEFKPYLEFYWKFMAVCAVILVIWGGMRATFDGDVIKSFLEDSVVLLLLFFIMFSGLSFLYNIFKNKTIIVESDKLIFKNRFGEMAFTKNEIEFITFGRERLFQFKEKLRVIKIKAKNRRRLITVKPARYLEDLELYESLMNFKK
jgi:cell division protein FtsL